jgi:phosphoserine phosphatase
VTLASQTAPAVLTTAAFYAAALAAVEGADKQARRIAVFDCDGTLWSGDAGSGFMRWTIAQGLLSPEAVSWLDARYQGYLAGKVDELAICGQMLQVYRGLTEAAMRSAAAEFFSTEIEHRIFPELRALVAEMQFLGVEIWAVSSTNNWVIEEGVRCFGIHADRVLAARVAIQNGLVTDTLLDVPTDEGKAASLAHAGITAPHAVFGNSIHDAAMLEIARGASIQNDGSSHGHAHAGSTGSFPVNPTPALIELAAARLWPIYHPASVAPATGHPPEPVGGEPVPVAGPSAGEPRG